MSPEILIYIVLAILGVFAVGSWLLYGRHNRHPHKHTDTN